MEVGLFVPCYINQFYPEVGIATLEILEKLGVKVFFDPSQTCCGQPIANSGLEHEAIPIYHHFVETFAKYDFIVAPSASCVYHVRKHYNVLEETEQVKHVRSKTYDLTEFLVDILKIHDLKARFPHRVGLHQGCHGLRGMRLAQSSERVLPGFSKWRQLLEPVQDIQLIQTNFADECCGFGGTFAVFEPELSVKMGSDKLRTHLEENVEYIASGDMSCLMHLDGIIKKNDLDIQVIHLAQILNSN